jgi:hypothetical protein
MGAHASQNHGVRMLDPCYLGSYFPSTFKFFLE